MASPWGLIVPEQGTNLILNPSGELAGNFGNHNSGTATRVTTYARFGDYCYSVATGATNRGMTLTVGALAAADHYITFYARGNAAATLEVSADATDYIATAVIGGATGGWVRYGVVIPALDAVGSVSIIIRDTANETFYIDGVMLQVLGYATTYIDGDQGGYYQWTGLRHASTSTRDSQCRSGGRERTFDEYGIRVLKQAGDELPPMQHNVQALSLQPGAVYQGYKVLPRVLELRLQGAGSGSSTPATAIASLHSKIKDLVDLLKPDLVAGAQPVTVFYTGATTTTTRRLYASFVLDTGLTGSGWQGGPAKWFDTPVRLLAVDPFWYEDDRVTATLDFSENVTAAYAVRRVNGAWAALGSGFSGIVYCIVVDQERGRVYFGGTFATANGVTVNNITYWDGTTFQAMGGTPGVAGGGPLVYAMALMPNGDLYVGGNFTSAGGSTADGLARWNVAAGTWSVFTNGTPGDVIEALAVDASGNLYGGGVFTNWDGSASEDYIWKYNGSAFSALGSGISATDEIRAIAVHPDGKVYVGGIYASGNSVTVNSIGYWNGTTFVAMGSTAGVSGGADAVNAILIRRNGNVVIAGDFTAAGGVSCANIAEWNGTSFTALGTGLSGGAAWALAELPNGAIVAGGAYTSAGGLSTTDGLAVWNGYTWAALDLDIPGTQSVLGLATEQGTLYVGTGTTGTANSAGRVTVTNGGQTSVYPDVSVIGPSSSSALLRWLENQTAGELLYFNLTVNTLETIGISFAPGGKSVSTLWSGRPGARPDNTGGGGRGDYTGGRGGTPGGGGYGGSGSLTTPGGGRFAGLIRGQPLPGSDFAAFHLQPGDNVIACFATGTTTGMVVVMHFVPRHWGVSGGAA